MTCLRIKDKTSLIKLKRQLIDWGYERDSQVNFPGTFSQVGDYLEVWPVNEANKYHLDFFGNNIEKIFSFEAQGQIIKQKELTVFPNLIEIEDGLYPPNTYIVHPVHGIGRFQTLMTRVFDDEKKLMILLEYAKGDKIYFPHKRKQELMVYLGLRKPKLTRLHSGSWTKTKQKVKKNLLKLAKELLILYSNRSSFKRPPFNHDQTFLEILDNNFQYQLTGDQKKSLEEIISSLTQTDFPQDHLLVGDVGFGKTEVALRAASIVLAAGYQVAILAPTTLLVSQHTALAQTRFKDLPIKISELSRFTDKSKFQRIESINRGQTDLVIGTHALLNPDIKFKNLGLLIIDEEQRFGVEQKEKIKKLRSSLDVISLSATPIPRTLFMSLSGLRRISLINQAPLGRRSVKVMVRPFKSQVIIEAIKKELKRQGQVFYINNRVRSMRRTVFSLIELLKKNQILATIYDSEKDKDPKDIVIGYAHGQMKEELLAKTMADFLTGKIDILVSSTIVENGLDHPNANTLIVEHAERFGLADLYQLKGRIGRRSAKAYAWLMIGGILDEGHSLVLTKIAQERLNTIANINVLGGGWQLALKDLELRGSGNLLGRQQHGFMEAVGLLLYSRLLKEAIDQVKKDQLKKLQKIKINEY